MSKYNYTFIGYSEDQDLLYFDDMLLHTCVCYFASEFTIEKLIIKIKERREMFEKLKFKYKGGE